MAWMPCLFLVSIMAAGIITLCSVQLVSSHNPIYLVLTVTFAFMCSCSVSALVYHVVNFFSGKQQVDTVNNQTATEAARGKEEDNDDILETLTGLPRKFPVAELEDATEGFSKLLGTGGFGSVYEGKLSNGTKVAVKRLEREGRKHTEFCSEVITITSVHHMNLVKLIGFCVQGTNRLLVYEFMEKGSVDSWLFGHKALHPLNWDVRFQIALDTARGLAYLHEDCRDRILHLDIKPQNILLDANFRAKVSDFGLARSMNREDSRVVTTMRGTPGYLAPEWLINLGVTSKTDVYSYGMVLLELVSGRKNVDHSENSENWYFPAVAYRKARELRVLEIVDPTLRDSMDHKQVQLVIKVAFWCIQGNAATRPSMSNVVRMFEGNMEVKDPPLSGIISFTNHPVFGARDSQEERASTSDLSCEDLSFPVSLPHLYSPSHPPPPPQVYPLSLSCPPSLEISID